MTNAIPAAAAALVRLAGCVLLLALRLLHADDVDGGALWYTLMVALLGLALNGLGVAWPDRKRL